LALVDQPNVTKPSKGTNITNKQSQETQVKRRATRAKTGYPKMEVAVALKETSSEDSLVLIKDKTNHLNQS